MKSTVRLFIFRNFIVFKNYQSSHTNHQQLHPQKSKTMTDLESYRSSLANEFNTLVSNSDKFTFVNQTLIKLNQKESSTNTPDIANRFIDKIYSFLKCNILDAVTNDNFIKSWLDIISNYSGETSNNRKKSGFRSCLSYHQNYEKAVRLLIIPVEQSMMMKRLMQTMKKNDILKTLVTSLCLILPQDIDFTSQVSISQIDRIYSVFHILSFIIIL